MELLEIRFKWKANRKNKQSKKRFNSHDKKKKAKYDRESDRRCLASI